LLKLPEQLANIIKPRVAALKSNSKIIKPYIPAVGFAGGWTWDSLTLKRIDNPADLLIIGAYLILAVALIVLISREVKFKYSQYFPFGLQFLFGGIISPFTVFYFKSSATFGSLLFTGLVVILLVANEFIEKRLGRGQLAYILFSICTFLYFTFLIPIIVGYMNIWVFLLSIIISILVSIGIIRIIKSPLKTIRPVILIYSTFLVFYIANIIPPVPLSTKQIGIYRSVLKRGEEYICKYEKPPWYAFNRSSESNFNYSSGDTVFCFSAIFAPTNLTKQVSHHWFFKKAGEWVLTDQIPYSINGGRSDGYRGYTYKTVIQPGRWKIMLKTDDGKTLGSVKFEVVTDGITKADMFEYEKL